MKRKDYKIGFDPAENLGPSARQVADRVITNFNADVFQSIPDLSGRSPKIVTSIAMFYDLAIRQICR
jgi:hypothetical protein